MLATLCDPSLCGADVPLAAPNYACADGAIAGPACVELSPGVCAWQILDCDDPDACTAEDCGPAPGETNWICPDDTIAGPACTRVNGVCTWSSVECGGETVDGGPPDVDGDPGSTDGSPGCECPDPAPSAPNYLCGDGQTIAGPACEPDVADPTATTCAWVIHACP